MITLTEKRLQELEQRIPVLLADIAEKQKKMQEIYSFPNDLADVKKQCEVMSLNLKEHLSRFFDLQSANEGRHIDLQKALKDQSDTLIKLKAFSENTDNQTKSQFQQIGELRNQMKPLFDKHNDHPGKIINLETRQTEHQNKIEQTKQDIKSAHQFIASLQFDTNNDRQNNEKILRNLEYYIGKIASEHSMTILQKDKDNADIREKISQIEQKLSQKPKDYDSEIADIKKDMVAILGLIHPSTANIPDQNQVSDKIKVIENSIAQIYTLLKKYEPKA